MTQRWSHAAAPGASPLGEQERLHLRRKQQLVAVGVVDLDAVVAPPGFLGGHGALRQFAAELRQSIRGQLDDRSGRNSGKRPPTDPPAPARGAS